MPAIAFYGVAGFALLLGFGYAADKAGEAAKDTSKAALYMALAFGVYLILTNKKGKLL